MQLADFHRPECIVRCILQLPTQYYTRDHKTYGALYECIHLWHNIYLLFFDSCRYQTINYTNNVSIYLTPQGGLFGLWRGLAQEYIQSPSSSLFFLPNCLVSQRRYPLQLTGWRFSNPIGQRFIYIRYNTHTLYHIYIKIRLCSSDLDNFSTYLRSKNIYLWL